METHPAANVIRMMTDEEYSALRDDIEKNGLLQPIVLCEGMILDGRNRHRACIELGISPTATKYNGDDPVGYVKSLNVKRRHLTPYEQIREALKSEPEIKAKAKERQKKAGGAVPQKSAEAVRDSRDELAKQAGVSHDTVAKVKKIEAKADDKTKQAIIDGELTINAAYKKLNVHVGKNTGESEWYTPQKYIDAARLVMGEIDCDPATTEAVNKRIKARKLYTQERTGLGKVWGTTVFMNPPYKQPLVSEFCNAFADKYEGGEIVQGIVLINNITETDIGQRLLNLCSAACFPNERVKFLDINGKPGAPLQGQMIIYFGPAGMTFRSVFKEFGTCLAAK